MAKQVRRKNNNKKGFKPNNNQPQRLEKVEAITYSDGITVADLAAKCNKSASDII